MKRLHDYDQHFLRSPELVFELIGHSNIRKSDLVYDLGAGSGVITSCLAKRAGQVVAVEVDARAVAKLCDNTSRLDNVSIVEGDIVQLPSPEQPYKVFANPPFSLSSAIVQKFTTGSAAKAIYLVVQKQFARKLTMDTQSYTGMIGAQIAPWYEARIRRPLRRTDFWPHPAVDTVFLELKQRVDPLIDQSERLEYLRFVEQCFSRQKYYQSLDRASIGISPEKMPSQLSTEQWTLLYRHFAARGQA